MLPANISNITNQYNEYKIAIIYHNQILLQMIQKYEIPHEYLMNIFINEYYNFQFPNTANNKIPSVTNIFVKAAQMLLRLGRFQSNLLSHTRTPPPLIPDRTPGRAAVSSESGQSERTGNSVKALSPIEGRSWILLIPGITVFDMHAMPVTAMPQHPWHGQSHRLRCTCEQT